MRDEYELGEHVPGKYLPLDSGSSVPASKFYLPEDLPPEIDLSTEIAERLGRAMHSLGRLDGFWSEVDDPETVFGLFVYKEAEQSSQVEGTQVTVSDMYRQAEDSKDVREARNSVQALRNATDELNRRGRSRRNVTLGLIKDLHETLVRDGRTDDEDPLPGEFRPGYAWIEESAQSWMRNVRFVPPKAEIVEPKMENLAAYVQSSGEYPDLVDIGIIHYQFETIHPFKDGNGRVGRLLIVLLMVACDILVRPLFYLSSYIRRNRDEYTDLLLRVNEEGDWEAWLGFFLSGIAEQADEAFGRAKLLLDLREEYRDAYRDASPSTRRLVEEIFSEPVLTVNRAKELIDVTYPPANRAVKRLEADGVLRETTGKSRYREFQADDILDVINRSADEIPDPGELMRPSNP